MYYLFITLILVILVTLINYIGLHRLYKTNYITHRYKHDRFNKYNHVRLYQLKHYITHFNYKFFFITSFLLALLYFFYISDYTILDILKLIIRINYCEPATKPSNIELDHKQVSELVKNVQVSMNPYSNASKHTMPFDHCFDSSNIKPSATKSTNGTPKHVNTNLLNSFNKTCSDIVQSQKLPKNYTPITSQKQINELIQSNQRIPTPSDIMNTKQYKEMQLSAFHYLNTSYDLNLIKEKVRVNQVSGVYRNNQHLLLKDYHDLFNKYLESQLRYKNLMKHYNPDISAFAALVDKNTVLFYKTNPSSPVFIDPRVFLVYKVTLQEIHNHLYSINTDVSHAGTLYYPDINWHNYINGIDQLTPLDDPTQKSLMSEELNPTYFNEKYGGLNVLEYYEKQKYKGYETPLEDLAIKHHRNIDGLHFIELKKHTIVNQLLPVENELKSLTPEDWEHLDTLYHELVPIVQKRNNIQLGTIHYFDPYMSNNFNFDPSVFEYSGYTEGKFQYFREKHGERYQEYYKDDAGYTYSIPPGSGFEIEYPSNSRIRKIYILNKKEYLNHYHCNNKQYLKILEYTMNKVYKNPYYVRFNALDTPETNYAYSDYSHIITKNDLRKGLEISKDEKSGGW